MSATRPYSDLKARIVTMIVEAGQTVALNRVVKHGTADNNCQHAGPNELGFGVVVALGSLAGAAGDHVQVAYIAGACVLPVLVGTGGATHGKLAKNAANGLTDATPDFNTPSATYVHGYFLQTGVAGDIVGLLPAPAWITE